MGRWWKKSNCGPRGPTGNVTAPPNHWRSCAAPGCAWLGRWRGLPRKSARSGPGSADDLSTVIGLVGIYVLGAFAGAAAYIFAYSVVKPLLAEPASFGRLTIPSMLSKPALPT